MTDQNSEHASANSYQVLGSSLELPCGAILKNRLAKSAMSDSLGDGAGDSTEAQARLYERWAEGGVALSVIGEVQGNPDGAARFDPQRTGDHVVGAASPNNL